jgi:hypothetical protein
MTPVDQRDMAIKQFKDYWGKERDVISTKIGK